jgi:hypothetical protein
MNCNIDNSILIGLITAIVLYLLIILIYRIEDVSIRQHLLMFATLFVIATAADYFNVCYTECRNVLSSLSYGVFLVSLFYVLLGIYFYKKNKELPSISMYLINVLLISGIHYVLCIH